MRARAAIGAKAMACVPVKQTFRLCQSAQLGCGQQALHSEAAQIELHGRTILCSLRQRLFQLLREDRAVAICAQQHRLAQLAKRLRLRAREKGREPRLCLAQARHFDFVIINGLFETALFDLKTVVHSQRLRYAAPSQSNLDGNSVDMDRERASFADNAVKYEATLRFINGSVRTMLDAMKGHNQA